MQRFKQLGDSNSREVDLREEKESELNSLTAIIYIKLAKL